MRPSRKAKNIPIGAYADTRTKPSFKSRPPLSQSTFTSSSQQTATRNLQKETATSPLVTKPNRNQTGSNSGKSNKRACTRGAEISRNTTISPVLLDYPLNSARQPQPGDRVDIWWENDDTYYPGTLEYVHKNHANTFRINYDDGEVEDVNLTEEKWRYALSTRSKKSVSNSTTRAATRHETEVINLLFEDNPSPCSRRRGRPRRRAPGAMPKPNSKSSILVNSLENEVPTTKFARPVRRSRLMPSNQSRSLNTYDLRHRTPSNLPISASLAAPRLAQEAPFESVEKSHRNSYRSHSFSSKPFPEIRTPPAASKAPLFQASASGSLSDFSYEARCASLDGSTSYRHNGGRTHPSTRLRTRSLHKKPAFHTSKLFDAQLDLTGSPYRVTRGRKRMRNFFEALNTDEDDVPLSNILKKKTRAMNKLSQMRLAAETCDTLNITGEMSQGRLMSRTLPLSFKSVSKPRTVEILDRIDNSQSRMRNPMACDKDVRQFSAADGDNVLVSRLSSTSNLAEPSPCDVLPVFPQKDINRELRVVPFNSGSGVHKKTGVRGMNIPSCKGNAVPAGRAMSDDVACCSPRVRHLSQSSAPFATGGTSSSVVTLETSCVHSDNLSHILRLIDEWKNNVVLGRRLLPYENLTNSNKESNASTENASEPLTPLEGLKMMFKLEFDSLRKQFIKSLSETKEFRQALDSRLSSLEDRMTTIGRCCKQMTNEKTVLTHCTLRGLAISGRSDADHYPLKRARDNDPVEIEGPSSGSETKVIQVHTPIDELDGDTLPFGNVGANDTSNNAEDVGECCAEKQRKTNHHVELSRNLESGKSRFSVSGASGPSSKSNCVRNGGPGTLPFEQFKTNSGFQTRICNLIARQVTVCLLETPHENDERLPLPIWATQTSSCLYKMVADRLSTFPSYAQAYHILSTSLGYDTVELSWFTRPWAPSMLMRARRNYTAWDPPPSDDEWERELVLLREVARAYHDATDQFSVVVGMTELEAAIALAKLTSAIYRCNPRDDLVKTVEA